MGNLAQTGRIVAATGPITSLPSMNITLHGHNAPSESLIIILLLSILSIAPSLLIMLTGFVQIVVVLSITRNALGLTAVPPNQVLAGLALFISIFIMAPTLTIVDHQAVQPYLSGKINAVQAYDRAQQPIKVWMLKQTRTQELALFANLHHESTLPPAKVSMTAVIPAFLLSELHSAFVIGFVIYLPFLVIDLVVSSILMSLGMMMLPPTLVSLPFKLLLFVLVDGWTLVVHALIVSFK
ncbi:MAG: flagellar type III secretion system pore protein FliP [Ferrimicrobium sp.]